MARIRTIKPEFWTSEQVADCSPTARLLFVGLWTFSDDAGRHPASVKRLKMEVFPADNFTLDQVHCMVNELIRAGLVKQYTHKGERFWVVTGWHHQKIEKPNVKYPEPREFDDVSATLRGVVGDESSNGSRAVDHVYVMESKGMESKGVESNGKEGILPATDVAEKKTKPELPEAFTTFWKAYPAREGKRRGKATAFKLWKAIHPDERALLQTATEHYAASKEARDGFAKDPERFFKADWWRDWIEPPEPPAHRSRVVTPEEAANWNPVTGLGE